jgi:SAM-dependent methyltransferase
MMEHVASVEGLNVLEVGCSDGLVCDLMVLMGAKSVVGIDVMQSAGCSFPNPKIQYRVENGAQTSFSDGQFDLCLSIATFEHVPDPPAVLREMLRVTKVGGVCYVQAGPLYHSPFGHHMFSYFGDYPWIHVRKSREEIVEYSRRTGIAQAIEKDLATSAEQYISGMLNHDHINGLFLEQYGLDEFRRRKDVEILKFNISYEGKDLLTPEILAETPHLKPETLVEHGFEIMFRRLKP